MLIENTEVQSTEDNTKMNETLFLLSGAYRLKDTYIGI